MDVWRTRRPSPALVVATIALFVALGGTAGGAVTAAIPRAKRALVADNAKRDLAADRLAGVRAPGAGEHGRGLGRNQDRDLVAEP